MKVLITLNALTDDVQKTKILYRKYMNTSTYIHSKQQNSLNGSYIIIYMHVCKRVSSSE